MKNALGKTSTSVFDAAGRLKASVTPLGFRTTYSYDAASQHVSVKDPLGRVSTSLFDAAGNIRANVDPLGNRTTYSFDSAGQEVAVKNARGYITTSVFDAASRRKATINALGYRMTLSYDAASRRVSITNPLGKVSTSVFTRLAAREPLSMPSVTERQWATTRPRGRPRYQCLGQGLDHDFRRRRATTRVHQPSDTARASLWMQRGQQVATQDALNNRTTTVFDAVGGRCHD